MSYIGARPDAFNFTSTSYDHFNGDGSTVTFTLSRSVVANSDIQVTVNNVPQDPGVAYYVSNLYTLTFTGAPTAGTGNIVVVYRNLVQAGVAPAANTVTSGAIASGAISSYQLAPNLTLGGTTSLAGQLISTINGASGGVLLTDNSSTTRQAIFLDSSNYLNINNSYTPGIKFYAAYQTYSAILDSNGNFGLGATPSSWGSYTKAIQVNNQGTFWSINSSNPNVWVSTNTYFDNTNFKYINSGIATAYQQSNGQHFWYNAVTGASANTMSLIQTMTLNASGYLGIGSTSPSTLLTIGGTAAGSGASGSLGVFLSRGVTTNFYEAYDGTKSFIAGVDNTLSYAKVGTLSNHNLNIVTYNGAGGTLTLDTSGNLGLGVAAPAWSIGGIYSSGSYGTSLGSVYGTDITFSTYYSGGVWKYQNGTYIPTWYSQASGQHRWYINLSGTGTTGNTISFTQAMTLDSSGRLGIGTTSPAQKLDVGGNINFTGNFFGAVGSGYWVSGNNTYGAGILGDSSTGNVLKFQSGGTEVARFNSSGQLGIGTTGPTANLQVNGNALVSASAWYDSSTWTQKITAASGTNTQAALALIGTGGSGGAAGVSIHAQPTGTGSNSYRAAMVNTITGDGSGPSYWSVNNFSPSGGSSAELMRLTYTGFLGIGTNNPLEALQVNGAIRSTTNAQSFTGTTGALFDYYSSKMRFAVFDGTNTGQMSLTTGGALTIVNGYYGGATQESGYAIPEVGGSSAWVCFGTFTNVAQVGNIVKLRINAHQGYNSNVGQDQITELYFKTSNGSAGTSGAGGGTFYGDAFMIGTFTGTTQAPGTAIVIQNNQNSYTIWGYFGAYTASSFFEVLYSGGVTFTYSGATQSGSPASGTYINVSLYTTTTSYSDDKLKDVIDDIPNALDIVDSLEPFSYNWKDEYRKSYFLEETPVKHYGMSAQKTEKILPDLVRKAKGSIAGDTDLKELNYEELIPILVKAVKEQKQIIESQATDISLLKSKAGI